MNDFAHEKWSANFKNSKKARFPEETGEGYRSYFDEDSFNLELNKPNVFAWVENPYYQYRDFELEAEASFGESTTYGAMGFCFRRMDENNYYYFLISSKGYYRFDLVFNGTPEVLIPWTPFDRDENKESIQFRIVAHGSRFLFFIEEDWVGEFDNEGISSGGFAWAGQNYDEGEQAVLSLERLSIESRPVDVEASYYRWGEVLPVDPEARFRLAESLYTMGAYASSLVQMRRLVSLRSLNTREILMVLRSQLGSGLYLEVLEWVPKLWEADGDNTDWVEIQGTALYRLNRFTELKQLLLGQEDSVKDQIWYWGLLGNTAYALGNWEEAQGAYEKALDQNPDEAIFWENLSRARKLQQDEKDAVTAQVKAAKAYFRSEDYEESKAILPTIYKADPENIDAKILEGKIYFQEGLLSKAEACFAALLENGCRDGSVLFLQGLIFSNRGDDAGAETLLKTAADQDQEAFIYQFKAAEFLHLRGKNPEPYLSMAIDLEEDPWALNLSGLVSLEEGKWDEAVIPLARAVELLPEEADIAVNYALALDAAGQTAKALELLGNHKGAAAANMRGNLFVHLNRFDEAVDAYGQALKEEPENRIYRLNCASACLEADQIHQAEELLRVLEEEVSSGEVRNLLGNLARLKGEYLRAETAYESALDIEPSNGSAIINLADLQFMRGKFQDSKEALGRLEPGDFTPRARRLEERLKDQLEKEIHCSSCERGWTVPREVGEPGALRLRGEIPDEAPAGKCGTCGTVLCVACAKPYLDEGRFRCPECGDFLKLSDKHLRYLLKKLLNLDE